MRTCEQVAEAFLLEVWEGTKHGDEAHRVWLRTELLKYAPRLAAIVASEPYLDEHAPWG